MQRVQESETLLSTLQQAFSDAKRNTQEQMVSSIFICELCIACSCQLCLDLNISSGKYLNKCSDNRLSVTYSTCCQTELHLRGTNDWICIFLPLQK